MIRRAASFRKLRRIVEDLAEREPRGAMYDECALCHESAVNAADGITSLDAHAVTCPWRRAREAVAEMS